MECQSKEADKEALQSINECTHPRPAFYSTWCGFDGNDTDTIVSKTITFLIIMQRTYTRLRIVCKNRVRQLVFPRTRAPIAMDWFAKDLRFVNRDAVVMTLDKAFCSEIFILRIRWYFFRCKNMVFSFRPPALSLSFCHSFSKFLQNSSTEQTDDTIG